MPGGSPDQRIAILGMGAVGRSVLSSLREQLPDVEFAVLERDYRADALHQELGVPVYSTAESLLSFSPDVVVEAAGHSAVKDTVPVLLAGGIDVILGSLGALADEVVHQQLNQAAGAGGAVLQIVAGSIGGLDVLTAARHSELNEVIYEGRKPPAAWHGTAAETVCDLNQLQDATVFFTGTARQAAAQYPRNANVAAAVALASGSFEQTAVHLIADPQAQSNSHTVHARGGFGAFSITLHNAALPQNPKSSWLIALSLHQAVLRRQAVIQY